MNKLELLHVRHKGKSLFFDQRGNAWYGKDEEQAFNPDEIETFGMFPPLFVDDIQNAYKLGLEVGKSELAKAAEELLDALTNQFMLWEESWDLYGEYFDCEPQWAVKIKMNQLREILEEGEDDF